MTSPSASPLQIVLAQPLVNFEAVPTAADSGEAVLCELFQLVMVDTLPAEENAEIRLSEVVVEESETRLSGRRSKQPPASPELPDNDEEVKRFWLALCPVPTTLTVHSRLEFGAAVRVVAGGTTPEPTLHTMAQARPPEESRIVAGLESQLFCAAPGVAPDSGMALRDARPSVILDGWMSDVTLQPDGTSPATLDTSRPSDTQIQTKPVGATEPRATVSSGEVHVTPASDISADADLKYRDFNGNTNPDKRSNDGWGEREFAPAPHMGRAASSATEPTGGNLQSGVVVPRSADSELNRSTSPEPVSRAHISPVEDPGYAASLRPPRSLTVRLQEPSGSPVDMHFAESKGGVRVTVRSENSQLAKAIAIELPNFARGLESRGWSSELQASSQFRESRPATEVLTGARERVQPDVQVPGAGLAQNEQSPSRQHRTDWDEEIEDRTTAAALRRLSFAGGEN